MVGDSTSCLRHPKRLIGPAARAGPDHSVTTSEYAIRFSGSPSSPWRASRCSVLDTCPESRNTPGGTPTDHRSWLCLPPARNRSGEGGGDRPVTRGVRLRGEPVGGRQCYHRV